MNSFNITVSGELFKHFRSILAKEFGMVTEEGTRGSPIGGLQPALQHINSHYPFVCIVQSILINHIKQITVLTDQTLCIRKRELVQGDWSSIASLTQLVVATIWSSLMAGYASATRSRTQLTSLGVSSGACSAFT